ncbi:hypothetical protein STEG23_005177 [Scotinomys teguina]
MRGSVRHSRTATKQALLAMKPSGNAQNTTECKKDVLDSNNNTVKSHTNGKYSMAWQAERCLPGNPDLSLVAHVLWEQPRELGSPRFSSESKH